MPPDKLLHSSPRVRVGQFPLDTTVRGHNVERQLGGELDHGEQLVGHVQEVEGGGVGDGGRAPL